MTGPFNPPAIGDLLGSVLVEISGRLTHCAQNRPVTPERRRPPTTDPNGPTGDARRGSGGSQRLPPALLRALPRGLLRDLRAGAEGALPSVCGKSEERGVVQ